MVQKRSISGLSLWEVIGSSSSRGRNVHSDIFHPEFPLLDVMRFAEVSLKETDSATNWAWTEISQWRQFKWNCDALEVTVSEGLSAWNLLACDLYNQSILPNLNYTNTNCLSLLELCYCDMCSKCHMRNFLDEIIECSWIFILEIKSSELNWSELSSLLTWAGSHRHFIGVDATLMVSGQPRSLDARLVTLQHILIVDQHFILTRQHAHVDMVHLKGAWQLNTCHSTTYAHTNVIHLEHLGWIT